MRLRPPPGALPAHRNPYRSGRLEELPYLFPAGWSWERLEARLARRGGRGVVIGPHGSGKTTLLLELGRRLEARGFGVFHLRFGHGRRRPTPEQLAQVAAAGAAEALLIDGAEQLSRRHWRKLGRAARHAGIVVLTSHRRGRLPVLYRTTTSAALLARLVHRLDPLRFSELSPHLEELHRRHHGDLRAALLALYDLSTSGPPNRTSGTGGTGMTARM